MDRLVAKSLRQMASPGRWRLEMEPIHDLLHLAALLVLQGLEIRTLQGHEPEMSRRCLESLVRSHRLCRSMQKPLANQPWDYPCHFQAC